MAKSYLEEFREEMAPYEKIYSEEIRRFASNIDFLSEVHLVEIPDILTLDYVYAFKKLNGVSEDEAGEVLEAFYKHMRKFSENNGLQEFHTRSTISFRGEIYEDD